MSGKVSKSDRWEKLKVPYRLTVMNNETFEEVGSYKLTLMNLYILLCMLLFAGAAIVLLLIFFTPIKKWIPGYQNITQNTEFIIMEKKLNSIEEELAQYRLYTEKLGNIIHGNPELQLDESSSSNTLVGGIPDIVKDNKIPEEEALRSKLETQEIISVSLSQPRQNQVNKSITQLYFIPPVSGEISAGFMMKDKHYGVDVLAPKNTPIKAVLDGYVISSDWTLETGNTLGIQHDNKMISFYKHNSQLLKSIGDQVRAGEAVAIIGNTGTLSDGPHLHFELWFDGKPVNPEDFIRF